MSINLFLDLVHCVWFKSICIRRDRLLAVPKWKRNSGQPSGNRSDCHSCSRNHTFWVSCILSLLHLASKADVNLPGWRQADAAGKQMGRATEASPKREAADVGFPVISSSWAALKSKCTCSHFFNQCTAHDCMCSWASCLSPPLTIFLRLVTFRDVLILLRVRTCVFFQVTQDNYYY